MTLSTVTDCGGSDGRLRIYRGSSYVVDSVSRARVQILVEEDMVGPVVDAIVATASPGEIRRRHYLHLPSGRDDAHTS